MQSWQQCSWYLNQRSEAPHIHHEKYHAARGPASFHEQEKSPIKNDQQLIPRVRRERKGAAELTSLRSAAPKRRRL